jgi:hypothetical protein
MPGMMYHGRGMPSRSIDNVPELETCHPIIKGFGGGVETQVSMGAYRPYSKTLYWTC